MKKKENGGKKKGTALKVVLAVLAGILAAILLTFATLMYFIPAFERADRGAVGGSGDWMARLDDALSLSEVVLPGTHDSASQHAELAFFSRCQSLSIGAQLEAGYRYLDIRLAIDGENMKLMHGFTSCTVSGAPFARALGLDTVLKQCYDFLEKHPTETVVFCVKQEHGDEPVAQFETVLDAIISKDPSYWLRGDSIPTVGQARGKLVLLRRYDDEAGLGKASGLPVLWADQGGREDPTKNAVKEEGNGYTLWVQDRYKYETGEKWAAFTAGLAAASSGKDAIALHFLSTNGSPTFGHPYKYAAALNKKLNGDSVKLDGWIIVDFASAKTAARIYRENEGVE